MPEFGLTPLSQCCWCQQQQEANAPEFDPSGDPAHVTEVMFHFAGVMNHASHSRVGPHGWQCRPTPLSI
ncbi:MAG: hypothetical protein EBU26_14845 [Verrucomicrobia bacterium]|nr:hypothetical protein [Verrucomicrobiota bacterium]